MAEKIDPKRDPVLKPEHDDADNQGATDAREVIEAQEDNEAGQ
jgi:hypothetical protein